LHFAESHFAFEFADLLQLPSGLQSFIDIPAVVEAQHLLTEVTSVVVFLAGLVSCALTTKTTAAARITNADNAITIFFILKILQG
jgi:uridylate kinase